MTSWLDTETKALLQKPPPEKIAPPDTKAYSLVLLSIFRDDSIRLPRAVRRICGGNYKEAANRLNHALPIVLTNQLTYADALLGQFEFISCNAVTVFVPDPVIQSASRSYLSELYESLLTSDEFAESVIQIDSVPDTDRGREFIDQFVDGNSSFPNCLTVPYKKARIMLHWGTKIGVTLSLLDT